MSTPEKNEILLNSKFENMPDKPGVYFFKNAEGTIIYIGKSKFLKRRIHSYFKIREGKGTGGTRDEIAYGQKLKDMVGNIADIEIVVTESEKEALLLENDMIKKYQPVYNVMLRDDKNFPWIVITYAEKFPRIRVIRAPRNQPDFQEKNKLIGPYLDVKPMKDTLKLLRKYFPYCDCSGPCKTKDRACVNYQLGLCPSPCTGKISKDAYLDNIKKLDKILSGDIEEILNDLRQNMKESSEKTDYEKAAKNRDAIQALYGMIERQTIINYDNKANLDVIGFFKTTEKIGFFILHVRTGRLSGKTPMIIETENKMDKDSEIIYRFLEQFYLNENRPIPDEIILPLNGMGDKEVRTRLESLFSVLNDKEGKEIKFRTTIEDDYTQGLMRIALNNARIMLFIENEYEYEISKDSGLDELKKLFELEDIPHIIEGFDISTWKMGEAVGAMVQFFNGKPMKKNYRSFIIKNQTQLGDSHMIFEVVLRRYRKQKKEQQKENERENNDKKIEHKQLLPDLILVDGGKAQVNAAFNALEKLDLTEIPVIGLKKKSIHTQIEEAVFPEGKGESIRLRDFTPGYNVLNRLSQEYHRRAISHHRKRVQKKIMTPKLDTVPGVGPTIRVKLLNHFNTTDKVLTASLNELQDVLGEKRGKNIHENIQKVFKPKKKIKLRR
ncbi:MAG: excinuclease ABC subunit UvrC [Promethearchaeota archaeon]